MFCKMAPAGAALGLMGAVLAGLSLKGATAAVAAPSTAPPAAVCGGTGTPTLVCSVPMPEDLFVVPGTPWVLASSLSGSGGLYVINARDKRSIALLPNAKERFDQAAWPTCKGPPDAAEKARFTTLGLYVGPLKNGVYSVYATRYPGAGSVQVFELDLRDSSPALTWVGCVPTPETMIANAIVPLNDGGFLVSNFWEAGPGQAASRAKAEAGEISGEVWSWHAARGWEKVPGSESSGTNGLAISPDNKALFVSQWGSRSFMRLSLGDSTPRRDVVSLPFRPDNVHWAPDGSLLLAGQGDAGGAVVKIDPATLKVTDLVTGISIPDVVNISAAVEVEGEIWVGTSRSPRIVVYRLPLPTPTSGARE